MFKKTNIKHKYAILEKKIDLLDSVTRPFPISNDAKYV